jgi:hypothetical protein
VTTAAPTKLRDFPPVEKNIEAPETLSKSKLERFDNCPRAFYLEVKNGGGTGSVEMDRGIAVHEAIERCINLMHENGEPTIPGEVARDIAEAVMKERLDLVLPAAEQDRVRLAVWNWAESQLGRVDPEAFLGAEIPMEMELNGWRLTCRIDRTDVENGTLYVTDFKSGFPGRREDAAFSFQGMFYSMMLLWGSRQDDPLQTYGSGIDRVWFYEAFPRITTGEDDKDIVVFEADWSRTELFEFRTSLERHLAQIERGLETGEWEPRDGSWCARCPASGECPIPAHLREVEEIESGEDAQVALSHKLALDRESARYQTALREWFKENGVVYLGDYAFDAKTSESRSVDWDAVKVGTPLEDATKQRTSTEYAPRKLTKQERDAHAA